MSTDDFIMALFMRVDTIMADVPKDPRAHLYPSEIVTLALLFALKGVGPRAFDRWLRNNYRSWFPGLPERTRLFRLFAAHADWAEVFLAQPTMLGVMTATASNCATRGAKTVRIARLVAKGCPIIAGLWVPN